MSPGTVAAKAFATPAPAMLLNGFASDPSALGPADLSTKIVLPTISIAVKPLESCTSRSPRNVILAPLAVAVTPSSDLELMAAASEVASWPEVLLVV